MADIVWHGEKIMRDIDAMLVRRIDASVRAVKNHARGKMGRSQPTARSRFTGEKRGLDPSKPGEYPKKVTAHGRRSVESEVNRQSKVGRIGSNVPYLKVLEMGSRKMARRPWLTLALRETRSRVKSIMERGKQ